MAVKVHIPTPLRPYTEKQETVEVQGSTVGEVLTNLTSRYSPLRQHLYSETGVLRSYVNVYVNDQDIRYLSKEMTRVEETDDVSIIPSIAGGVDAADVESPAAVHLSQEEILRYSRHLIIPEVGMDGQRALKRSRVLLIGAGGLGSPLAMYLSAAGIGTIGLVDFDSVDLSNLQRQIIHSTSDIGKPKLDSAVEAIQGINPHVVVVPHPVRLTSENAMDILGAYDVVVDGTDNFPTRYLVNDACVLLGKPNVYGSIYRFDGQITVFDAKRGPCYRCLYPTPPPPGLVPSCAEGGVLGVLPGIIGTLQALEVIKVILEKGDTLIGRLVLFDALRFAFKEYRLRKDPSCPICGTTPTIHTLIDYETFCGLEAHGDNGKVPPGNQISVEELNARLNRSDDLFLLDVREPHESEIANIGGTLIPLHDLAERISEVDQVKPIVVYCKTGVRSARAVKLLKNMGFARVMNLTGGIHAWSQRIDPRIPRY
jgi:sulfur-carrier protein adenylyltransferase/sulfurtransferase